MINNYVVIPFLEKLEMTAALVRQLIDQGDVTEFILLDNGPMPKSEYPWDVDEDAPIRTISCPEWNLHAMWNFGIEMATQTESKINYIFSAPVANVAVMNNDLEIVSDSYIAKLAEGLRSMENLAMVSGTHNDYESDDLVMLAHFESGVQGNSMMVKTEVPFRFDERFEWWYGDNDFGAQCENGGYFLGLIPSARHIHLDGGSVTTNALSPERFAAYQEGTMRDRLRFHKKWPQIPVGVGALPRELLF
jgi:hypothetical protein